MTDQAESSMPTLDFDAVVSLVLDRPGLFLRYSAGPGADRADGPSRDYEADVDLPGWSVTTVYPEPWWTRPAEDWIARRICKYAELHEEGDRRPWLLTGTITGTGPDHEPLVVDMHGVAWVGRPALEEALQRYRQHFDVSADSRSA